MPEVIPPATRINTPRTGAVRQSTIEFVGRKATLVAAPYGATYLAQRYGLRFVGYYLATGALLSLVGLLATRETKDEKL